MAPSVPVEVKMAIAELVREYTVEGRSGSALLAEVRAGVARGTSRYPDCWFELGERSPEAIASLASDVFHTCACKELGRYPFQGRTPFRAYVEEGYDDPPIRRHTFHGRLSVTIQLLARSYHRNVRRSLALRWRQDLYRAVGEVLVESAEPVGDGRPRWRFGRLGVVRPIEVAMEMLTRQVAASDWDRVRAGGPERKEPLRAVVCRLLTLTGRPLRQSEITNRLADHLGAPVRDTVVDIDDPEAPVRLLTEDSDGARADAAAIRAAVRDVWSALDADARALLAAVARGDDYDTMIARSPALKSRVGASRAIARIDERFVAVVAERLGVEADPRTTPLELVELVLAVLRLTLPELDAHGA